jgi:gliding motility-associated-like protein
MRIFLLVTAFVSVLAFNLKAQVFPNPATLSTGQGPAGSLDPIWTVSPWYATNPPNPLGLTYGAALINNNCAPGAWVDPAALPPPVNNGNWITGNGGSCGNNSNDGYIYFRLALDLPADCNGNSVATSGNYVLYFNGYADNTITDVFVNGTSTGISGGSYNAPLSITLTGPWVAGMNYVDVQVYNFPNGGSSNPYGLLLVANSVASSNNDGDGDGIVDINDQCPCQAGTLANGCAPVVISGDTVLCAGETTTLTATGLGTFLWSTGATTAAITITPGVTTRYSVTATASNGYVDSAAAFVTVNTLPVVSINPASVSICAGSSTTLTASGAVNYVWSNAASTTAITDTPAGTSSYTVTGTDANLCSATATSTVTVNPLPVAAITPAPVTVCAGNSVTYTASGGTGYAWSTTDNTAAITVTPLSTTNYSVTVTDANTCTATATTSVTVNQLPVAAINPASVSICNGASTTLTASGGTSYTWSNAANTAAITVNPTVFTTYAVTVTDANTCTATASADVTVNALPVASITPASDSICEGESTTLTAAGATTYAWSNSSNTASITVSPSASASYSVTVTDGNNCTASASASVTVVPAMVTSVTKTDIDCNGANNGAINLTVSSGQLPYAYLWSNADVYEDLQNLPPGVYSVVVTDNAGCSTTTSATIAEPAALVLASSFINPTCETITNDGSITLTTSGGTVPYQFIWSNGAGSADLLNLAPGNYEVTVTDANNCTTGAVFALNYIYDFAIQVTPPVTIKLGENTIIGYTLTGNAGNYTAVWSPFSTLSCSDCVLPVASPNATTTYNIEVKNDAGCSVNDKVTVTVVPDYSVFVPNAFTPNNDGNNDVFKLFGITRSIVFLQIQIFNRIGEKVFESQDHDFAWDGTYQGVLQTPSVFTWQLKLTFIDGHREELRKGTLTLLK